MALFRSTVGSTLPEPPEGSRPSGPLLLLTLPLPFQDAGVSMFTAPVATCTHLGSNVAHYKSCTSAVQARFHETLHVSECASTQKSGAISPEVSVELRSEPFPSHRCIHVIMSSHTDDTTQDLLQSSPQPPQSFPLTKTGCFYQARPFLTLPRFLTGHDCNDCWYQLQLPLGTQNSATTALLTSLDPRLSFQNSRSPSEMKNVGNVRACLQVEGVIKWYIMLTQKTLPRSYTKEPESLLSRNS